MTDEQVQEMWLEGRYDELVSLLKDLVASIANPLYDRTMAHTEVGRDDVFSWALEAMWKAILGWDPDTGIPLRGWVVFKVRRDIIDIQRSMLRQKRGGIDAPRKVDAEVLDYISCLDNLGQQGDSRPITDGQDGPYSPGISNKLAHSMLHTRKEEDAAAARIDVETILGKLPEHQQQILRGLATGASLRDVGKALDKSHEWVRLEAEKARAYIRGSLA